VKIEILEGPEVHRTDLAPSIYLRSHGLNNTCRCLSSPSFSGGRQEAPPTLCSSARVLPIFLAPLLPFPNADPLLYLDRVDKSDPNQNPIPIGQGARLFRCSFPPISWPSHRHRNPHTPPRDLSRAKPLLSSLSLPHFFFQFFFFVLPRVPSRSAARRGSFDSPTPKAA